MKRTRLTTLVVLTGCCLRGVEQLKVAQRAYFGLSSYCCVSSAPCAQHLCSLLAAVHLAALEVNARIEGSDLSRQCRSKSAYRLIYLSSCKDSDLSLPGGGLCMSGWCFTCLRFQTTMVTRGTDANEPRLRRQLYHPCFLLLHCLPRRFPDASRHTVKEPGRLSSSEDEARTSQGQYITRRCQWPHGTDYRLLEQYWIPCLIRNGSIGCLILLYTWNVPAAGTANRRLSSIPQQSAA